MKRNHPNENKKEPSQVEGDTSESQELGLGGPSPQQLNSIMHQVKIFSYKQIICFILLEIFVLPGLGKCESAADRPGEG